MTAVLLSSLLQIIYTSPLSSIQTPLCSGVCILVCLEKASKQ